RDKSRKNRIALARLVYRHDFFECVRPVTNSDHIKRREWLVARKAWRLIGDESAPPPPVVAPQVSGELTTIEWLCLAGTVLINALSENPLAALIGREPV